MLLNNMRSDALPLTDCKFNGLSHSADDVYKHFSEFSIVTFAAKSRNAAMHSFWQNIFA
jgi:hypothetical protein